MEKLIEIDMSFPSLIRETIKNNERLKPVFMTTDTRFWTFF